MSDSPDGSVTTDEDVDHPVEAGRDPTDLEKKTITKMAQWAVKHDIDYAGFNDDGTVVDTDGNEHESPFVVGLDPHETRELDGYVECDGCGVTYSHNQGLTFIENGEPVCPACADSPDAVAYIRYCHDTEGNSWHKIGEELPLNEVNL